MDFRVWTVFGVSETEVPWNLCHDHAMCAKVNTAPDGRTRVEKALCTINGFWMEERTKDFSQCVPTSD